MVVQFGRTEWEDTGLGMRSKKIVHGDHAARLVELSDTYREEGWCRKRHLGFVISGRLSVLFRDRVEEVTEGDGLIIHEGEEHRASVPPGMKTRFVLYDRSW